MVGVTHECDHPAAARERPALTRDLLDNAGRPSAAIDRHIRRALHEGSGLYGLDEERLAALRPDLVVTQELCAVCAVAYAEVAVAVRRIDAATPVLSLEPEGLDDVLATITALGAATGRDAPAADVVAALRARLDRVAALPPPGPRPRVVCVEWTDPLMVGGHWVPEMVALAGGDDVLGRPRERSVEVAWDAVVGCAPEVLVLMPCGFDLAETLRRAPEVLDRPGAGRLPAVITGRVVAVDGSGLFNRPGPRLVDGTELLATVFRAVPGSPLPDGAAWVTPATPG